MGGTSTVQIQQRIDALVLDMDGVIYRGDEALTGAVALFPALREAGISVILATNNATQSPAAFQAKLARMGITVPEAIILTSVTATVAWLQGTAPAGARVYCVGAPWLHEAVLALPGWTWAETRPDFVVVGLDPDVTYAKLRMAAVAVQQGARLIATNQDASLPVESGENWPGAGALIAAIATTVGHGPEVVLGKPEPALYDLARARLGTAPAATLAVGDRAETDILGGRRAGLPTALVLTGVTRPEQVAALPPEMQPDYIFDSLEELTRAVLAARR
jgi:4-nitrophenyl phosphatase